MNALNRLRNTQVVSASLGMIASPERPMTEAERRDAFWRRIDERSAKRWRRANLELTIGFAVFFSLEVGMFVFLYLYA